MATSSQTSSQTPRTGEPASTGPEDKNASQTTEDWQATYQKERAQAELDAQKKDVESGAAYSAENPPTQAQKDALAEEQAKAAAEASGSGTSGGASASTSGGGSA
jgi:hypothetical protein